MKPTGESEQRLRRIADALGDGDPASLIDRLCPVCVDLVGVTGAGVTVRGPHLPSSLCASGPVAALLEELSLSLGEGPAVDAHAEGVPVEEPDLADPATPRWPIFRPRAVEAGAEAMFAFPLRIGAVRLGSLMVYRDRPGRLSDAQHHDAIAMSSVAMDVVLATQAQAAAGGLGVGLDALSGSRAEVHQAAGMVSVQAGVMRGRGPPAAARACLLGRAAPDRRGARCGGATAAVRRMNRILSTSVRRRKDWS